MQPKQKLVAGLLGIFLGAWGIHQFYLGDNKKGIIRILTGVYAPKNRRSGAARTRIPSKSSSVPALVA